MGIRKLVSPQAEKTEETVKNFACYFTAKRPSCQKNAEMLQDYVNWQIFS